MAKSNSTNPKLVPLDFWEGEHRSHDKPCSGTQFDIHILRLARTCMTADEAYSVDSVKDCRPAQSVPATFI